MWRGAKAGYGLGGVVGVTWAYAGGVWLVDGGRGERNGSGCAPGPPPFGGRAVDQGVRLGVVDGVGGAGPRLCREQRVGDELERGGDNAGRREEGGLGVAAQQGEREGRGEEGAGQRGCGDVEPAR